MKWNSSLTLFLTAPLKSGLQPCKHSPEKEGGLLELWVGGSKETKLTIYMFKSCEASETPLKYAQGLLVHVAVA